MNLLEPALGRGERGEQSTGEELFAQGAVEAFDLAGRGGAARRGQSVRDPVLSLEIWLKSVLGVTLAEAIRGDLAVISGAFLSSSTPQRSRALAKGVQTGRQRGPEPSPQRRTMNRL